MTDRLTALTVDPNLDSRLETGRVLYQLGMDSVGDATYGTEALVMTSDHNPDVILLALEENSPRGIATLEALQEQAPDVPVIVYSSSLRPELIREAMRAGARDFITHPLDRAEFRDAVNTTLAREGQRQEGRTREAAPARARGTILTVAGAKGGIGKTTIATNLAVALRMATGQEVALVDADAQFGDVAIMLDMIGGRSIADLAREQIAITRESIAPYIARHTSGLDVIMAGSEPDDWRALRPEHLTGVANALAETHEWVVIDTPGTMNEAVAASLSAAQCVLLVTSLDVSSIKDTKTALRILRESWGFSADRIQLIVNDNNRAAMTDVTDVIRATGINQVHLVRHEAGVALSVQAGVPMVIGNADTAFARSMMTLARTISGTGEARTTAPSMFARLRPSFLSKPPAPVAVNAG